MATVTEIWYVRLPNGRTLRARGADVVRRQLRAGRIPPESRARRPGDAGWLPLQRIAEFAGVVHAVRSRSLVDGAVKQPAASDESRSLGTRGVIEQLLQAFDSALGRAKLAIAALTGIALALGLIGFEWAAELPAGAPGIAAYVGASVFVLAVVALASALLTRMTLIELDREHRAGAANIWSAFLRILVAQAIVAGVVLGALFAVRAAVPALTASDWADWNWLRDGLAGVLAVLRVLLEVVCWPIIAVAVLLLGPVLVIEEEPIGASLRAWLGLLRRHLGRIYLYEALAFLAATVLALPMLLMVGGAAYALDDALGAIEWTTLVLLAGLALTPLIAYLIVANVFVYINLRYQFYFSARRR